MSGSGPDRPTGGWSGRSLHPGTATGTVLRLEAPLSFWGGVDSSGTVVDHHHPQHGASVTGRVLAMSSGRGSSSSTAVLAELIRSGAAPAALVLGSRDSILVVGALVAREMYDLSMPIVELGPEQVAGLPDGALTVVAAGEAAGPATVTLEER
jgi:predicted aconitase with swiveling domain